MRIIDGDIVHAKWIEETISISDGVKTKYFMCSNCEGHALYGFDIKEFVHKEECSDYCPHCGAKMDIK